MDTFIEQIVRKKKGGKEWAIIAAVLVGILVILFVCLLFPQFTLPIAPFIVAALAFGGWFLISTQNTEFEYCVTNGDIDVDTIIDRRKRKRIVSVSGRKVESLLPYDESRASAGFQRIVMAAPSLNEQGLWCFTYHSKKNGHTLVVFQPEERVLKALYAGLPKLVQMDTRRAADALGIKLDTRRTEE